MPYSGIKICKCDVINSNNRQLQIIHVMKICSSSSYSVFIPCCLLSRDGRIHPIPSAIARTPSLHFDRFRASSFFKPIFSCLLLHLLLPGLFRSSSLPLATHFKIQSNPQNTIIIPPQLMSIPSNFIRYC